MNPHEIVAGRRATGNNYVLISDAGMNVMLGRRDPGMAWLTPSDVAVLDQVRHTDLKWVWDDAATFHGYSLYQIRCAAGQPAPGRAKRHREL